MFPKRLALSLIAVLSVSVTSCATAPSSAPAAPTASEISSSSASAAATSLTTAAPPASSGPHSSDTPATGSASLTTSYPFTVDNCGIEVTFTHAPDRVLAIKSTSIEMMFALGVSDRLVGVAFPDGPYAPAWAPATPPSVISDKVPGQEATLALDPDLVYAGWESNVTADGAGDRSVLQRLGVATFVSPAACQEAAYQPHPLTWPDVFAEIRLVGKIFDVQKRSDALVDELSQRLSAVHHDDRKLTALWYSSGTKAGIPFVGGGIGSPQMVMDTVGLTNIAADIPMTWSSMSWEAIIAADPDVIVVVDSSWGSAAMKIASFEKNPAVAALTAVKNKRYLIVPFPAGEAGVRSVEAAETLSEQLADLALG